MLIMVTGVSGSGKSEYAEQISCQLAKDNKKYYVATMYPYGEDGIRDRSVSRGLGDVYKRQFQVR